MGIIKGQREKGDKKRKRRKQQILIKQQITKAPRVSCLLSNFLSDLEKKKLVGLRRKQSSYTSFIS